MLKVFKQYILLTALLTCCLITLCKGQEQKQLSAAELLQSLKKLNVLGSVLYVAAHPDDENTRLITYLSNEKLYNTAYLSITRGDGGQNLIGPEIREKLGIIRTQELLQARKTDGGKQFFTRANDFGYSKTAEETFTIWDKEQVLKDMVWVIRKFRPDVMVTRFPGDERAGHGQHAASAILASEAFHAAADPKRFPEQLKYVNVWQPKRLLWNTGPWSFKSQEDFNKYISQLLQVDVGGYSPLLGKSYGEIAAASRSMHKSQGFGAAASRGKSIEYLEHTEGEKSTKELMEGVDTSWERVEGRKKIEVLINKAISGFKPSDPSAVVPDLIAIKKALHKLPDSYWKQVKLEEVQDLLQQVVGLYLEIVADDYTATKGEQITLNIEAINRSSVPVKLQGVDFVFAGLDTAMNIALTQNEALKFSKVVRLPDNLPISQPYWLRESGSEGMFAVSDPLLIGLPENKPAAHVNFSLTINGEPTSIALPVVYKKTDPVEGEVYRPFVVIPDVSVNIQEGLYMFVNNEPKKVQVVVKAGKENIRGQVSLQAPASWVVEPKSHPFSAKSKGEEQVFTFLVTPPASQDVAELKAIAQLEGSKYDRGIAEINYRHIPAQVVFPEASAKIVKLDLAKNGQRIGYLMGAGDDIPSSLEQIGYHVTILKEEDMHIASLKKFDAIILGVRAYNTYDRLKHYQPTLMEYVKQGGNMIVQYNTSHGLVLQDIGPYPLKLSRERVTVEDAEVRLLKPAHPVLNFPNKITAKDFDGWVQERGLYFPNEWDEQYEAILSSNDPREPARDGGLLIAKYGKGHFVYTGYSWFRQLPAGVPGAFRLFTNLISLGHGGEVTDAKSQKTIK